MNAKTILSLTVLGAVTAASAAVKTARGCGVTTEELLNMLHILLEEESL